jgi:hypothetical protein
MLIFNNSGQPGVKYEFRSTDPNRQDFLAPSDTSPQREAAAGALAEAYVGAIGPQ